MGQNNFERYFSFFNFRLGTYNVPSGSSAISLTRRPKAGRARSASLMGLNLMSSWGSGSKISKLEQVGDFFIFGCKSSPFYFTSRWVAFFCEKLKKYELFFFLIFCAFCRYCTCEFSFCFYMNSDVNWG